MASEFWESISWEGPKPHETVVVVDENEASGDFFLVLLMTQALRAGKIIPFQFLSLSHHQDHPML